MSSDLSRLAVHEASHCVVGDCLGWPLEFVRVTPDGLCQWDFAAGEPDLESLLICRFAGAAGEVICFGGEPQLHFEDYTWATRALRDSYDSKTVRRLCGQAQVQAEDILHDQWLLVCFLTTPLLNAGCLDGTQARVIMQPARNQSLMGQTLRRERQTSLPDRQ